MDFCFNNLIFVDKKQIMPAGFFTQPRLKVISRKYAPADSTISFSSNLTELDVMGEVDQYTIDGISSLNGKEGHIEITNDGIDTFYVFLPFSENTRHRIKYIGNGLPADFGTIICYAEIFDDKIWLDYDSIIREY